MPDLRPLTLCAIALLASGCSKKETPAPANPLSTAPESRSAAKSTAPRERREYSDMPTGPRLGGEVGTTATARVIEAEALRGGPHGEARVFENAQEQAENI